VSTAGWVSAAVIGVPLLVALGLWVTSRWSHG